MKMIELLMSGFQVSGSGDSFFSLFVFFLFQYFSAFGKVVRAVKSVDKTTGAKKTFGFVDFAEYGIVKKVILCSKHYIQVNCQKKLTTQQG